MTARRNIAILIGFVLSASLLSASVTAALLERYYGRAYMQTLGQICEGVLEHLTDSLAGQPLQGAPFPLPGSIAVKGQENRYQIKIIDKNHRPGGASGQCPRALQHPGQVPPSQRLQAGVLQPLGVIRPEQREQN